MRNVTLKIFFAVALLISFQKICFSQFGPSPWNAPSGTYTVPAGVTQITVTCYGGGGAGGGASTTSRNGGGGGGGASVTVTNYAVTPGQQITVAVGAGGTGVSAGTGNSGGASSVNIVGFPVFISAAGGEGGTRGASSSSAGAGGSGGLIANNIPVNTGFNGGNGGNSDPTTTSYDRSGGGGGGAGTTAAGGNGATCTGGGSGVCAGGSGGTTGGGAGGTGRTTTTSTGALGGAGVAYGGGGGGSTTWNSGSRAGGAGAAGAVIITYVVVPCNPPTSITTSATPSSSCNASQSVTFNVSSHSGGNLNGGSWEYQWQDGAAVVQAWSATSSYVTTLTSTKTFTVYMRSTACTGSVSAGFGATYTRNTIPAQPDLISGLASPCTGSSQTYSVTNVAGVTYTWTVPAGWSITSGQGTNSITTTVAAGSGSITVTPSNVCGNGTARTLAVNPGAGPTVTVSPNPASVCGGVGVSLTASGSVNYSWSPATGLSATTGATVTATPTATTVYTVTETTSGCNNFTTVNVRVGGVVSASATPSSATSVCPGGVVNLTGSASENTSVTLLTQNFQSAIAPWTLTNTNVAAVAWTLRNSPYTASGQALNSGSQFVLSNSDAGGSGSSGTTTITSPTFSTVGMTTANLSFRHYYRYYGTESANVEVYDGSGWVNLATYTSTQGAYNAFTTVNISLTPYVGITNCQVRFRYVSSWDYGWSLDDISVTGTTPPGAFSYAWTSTPAGFTSSAQNPTANPTVATTYNLTATQTTSGCTGTASTALVSMYPVPQGSLTGVSPNCSGYPASLTWTATSGTGPYSLNYNPSSQTSSGVVSGTPFNTQNNTVTGANNYSLISVTDANGCVRTSGFTDGTETVTGNASPTAPTCSNQSRCSVGSVTFTAGGAGAGEGYKWYNVSTGGTALFTGNPYTTGPLSITTDFWVAKYQTGAPNCEGPRTKVTAIINVGGIDAYTATRNTGITYTDISGTGTAVTSWRNGTDRDNNLSNSISFPAGFTFPFDGGYPASFLVSVDGFITFNTATKANGADLPTCGTAEPYTWDNTLFTEVGKTGSLQAIAPFYNDLYCNGYNANNTIHYETSGSSPNRVFTIQWRGVANDISCDASCWSTYGNLNFQIKLYETSGNIEFLYGPTMTQTTYGGCSGGDNCTLYNTYTAGINSNTMSSTPTLTQLFTQQTANTATFNATPKNDLTTLPTTNSKITFTRSAPPPATGIPTCGSAPNYPSDGSTNQCTNTTLSWTAGDQVPTSYDIYFGTTNPPPFIGNQTSTQYNPTLASNTTYYWKVVPKNSFGDLASPVVRSFTTGVPNSVTSITLSAGTNTGGNNYTVCSGQNATITPIGTLAENSAFNWTAPFVFDLGCNGIPYPLFGNCAMNSDNNTYTNSGTSDVVYRYYIKARGCNGITACQVMNITVKGVNTLPSVISSSSGNPICSGNSTTLSVTGTNLIAGASNQWYTGSCGGTWIGSGNSIAVSPGVTTTYYVRGEGGATCPSNSSCRTLTITVNPAPTSNAGSNSAVCTGTSPITMTGSTAGGGGGVSSAVWSGCVGLGTWNNNGTPTNPADDYFTPSVSSGSCTATLTVNPVCSGTPATSTRTITWNSTVAGECRWLGTTNTDWFTASNWCNTVPTSTTDVIIPSGMPNNPDINGVGAECKSITINSGSSLTITGTNNLDVYGSWTLSGGFTANSSTVSFRGSTAANINSTTSFNSLTMNKASSALTLNAPVSVAGALTMTNGVINSTNTNVITLGTAATATGGNAGSFVSGPLIKQGTAAFIYPIGKNGRWARLRISAPTVSSDFRAEYFDTPYSSLAPIGTGLTHVSNFEYWQLDRLAGTGNCNVRLYWEDASWSQIEECNTSGDLVVAHWTAGTWNDRGSPSIVGTCTGNPAPSTGWVQSNSISTFSPFTFGSKNARNSLPVSLSYFNAFCLPDKRIDISWITLSEINSDYFILEKSYDGLEFFPVTQLKAAGNSNTPTSYLYTDIHTSDKAKIFYRLQQFDFDGKKEVFNPVAVNCEEKNHTSLLELFPNPARTNVNVQLFNSCDNKDGIITIVDVLGKKYYEKKHDISKGINNWTINIQTFPAGIYYVSFECSEMERIVNKLVIH